MKNREIKFRVWNQKNGWYFSEKTCPSLSCNGRFDKFDVLGWYGELIIEQFTGFYDKNGKEVYEGDLLISDKGKEYEHTWKVAFSQGCFFLFDANNLGDKYGTYTRKLQHGIQQGDEVIGNIHENPELLT